MPVADIPNDMTPNQRRTSTSVVWVSALTFMLATVSGVVIGVGAYTATAALALLPLGIYLMMRPDLSLISFTGLTLLIAGSLKYFFGLGQFQWALSALGAALLVYSLVNVLFSASDKRTPASGIEQAMLLWWVGLLFATAVNAVPALDWFVGLRIYLPFFGIFLYLGFCRPSAGLLKNILLFMIAIASVQWAFCLYQKVYVVPLRIASHYPGSPWDSIVGSFGGDRFGGGESGSLGIYLSIMLVLAAALYKQGQLRGRYMSLIIITSFAAMALAESKVIAVMVPLGCFLVYRDHAFKHPIKFALGTLAVLAAMLVLLVIYYQIYWQTESKSGLIDSLYARFAYSFDPHFQASSTDLGRVKSLLFWWNQHWLSDNPLHLLFGHGIASAVSSSSVIGMGDAARQTGVMLDGTGISKLLWESGLVGLLVFLSVFGFGYFRARTLKHHSSLSPWHQGAMVGTEAAMVLMPISVFYEVTVVSSPPMQFMAMFFLGYVAYWWQETSGARLV
jgi:hypothetical protein